ncbi:hypothetical protein ACFPOI_04025 [Nonomuraea angiospora]|uniref:Transposase n=1 Tax=Nonomuraea angiospora TaxID=46172 RepID=A0ABR9MB86_9ACTN|nr:hypothetical protein [Nonomuraea angiospora]MBE1590178.1 hypothetical protein [Nonomuraea angiospora]
MTAAPAQADPATLKARQGGEVHRRHLRTIKIGDKSYTTAPWLQEVPAGKKRVRHILSTTGGMAGTYSQHRVWPESGKTPLNSLCVQTIDRRLARV